MENGARQDESRSKSAISRNRTAESVTAKVTTKFKANLHEDRQQNSRKPGREPNNSQSNKNSREQQTQSMMEQRRQKRNSTIKERKREVALRKGSIEEAGIERLSIGEQ